MLRGIISPPRSRYSSKETRPYNNAPTNPPPKPNYKSPCRRPATPVTAVKSSAVRATKNNHRSSNTSRVDPSKSTSKTASSRRQIVAPHPNKKKLENSNSTPKTATKIITRSSNSPRPTKRVSQPTRGSAPSKSNVKGAIGCGSRSDISGAKDSATTATSTQKYFDSRNSSPKYLRSSGSGHQQDVKSNGDAGNQTPCYSAGHYDALGDPHVRDRFHQLSIDGKDLENMVLHANSIYESIGSDTKEEECYSQSNNANNNGPRIFQIYKEVASHRQGNSSITSYVTKLKALWDELATHIDMPQCSCGSIEKLSEHMEREKVMQFLTGLNDSYYTFCAQILLMRPFPTVEKAYSVIIQEEKRRDLVLSLEIVAAKVIQNNWLPQNGHWNNVDDSDGIEEVGNKLNEQQVDQNEVTRFPIEPLPIDLGSPVRC